jgi:hypothetical protein
MAPTEAENPRPGKFGHEIREELGTDKQVATSTLTPSSRK